MGEAEVIPIGTTGRPGRGSGDVKPSSSSRNLAGRSARSARDGRPAAEAPHETGDETRETTSAVPPEAPADAAPAETEVTTESEKTRAPRGEAGSPRRSQVHVDHRRPERGIPVMEWVGAAVNAARTVFGTDWEPRLAELLAFTRRRITGDYAVDDFGFDREITERFLLELLRPLATKWFRIEVVGEENIPAEGGALIVSNHSGTVPLDGLMTMFMVHERTGRFLRALGADLVFRLPVISELARKGGATLACNEDAERMLREGELVGVWPEGFKGIGKPFSERYKLQRFGRGGFVSAAIRTGVPIIPVSIVGAEEIYPLVGNISPLARLLGVPYLPVTPTFPLLGPLGMIPLPSKWIIEFGEPIRTDDYDTGAAEDPMLVFNVTDQVRESIQQTLYDLLIRRKSVFG